MSRFFLNNIYYFITCPTLNLVKFFDGQRKDFILRSILLAKEKFQIIKLDFGINSNHYHLLVYCRNGAIIPQFLKNINGPTAMAINKLDKVLGRKIWGEYYVYYVTNDEVLQKIKGYVIGNPYKHKEILSLENLKDYKYSSFKEVANKIGLKNAEDLVLSVINLNDSDFVKELEKINANKLAWKREQVPLENNL